MGRIVITCAICMAFATSSLAQDDSARARQILSNPLTEVREALLALGDAAIDPIVEALDDERQGGMRQVVLIEVLGSLHSRRSNKALAHLLDDTRPFVRARAVSVLGRNHEVCAVPHLVRLLGDNAEHAREVSTDPYRERPVTVRETAAAALQTITGLQRKAAKDSANAKAFTKWWDNLKNRPDCSSWD